MKDKTKIRHDLRDCNFIFCDLTRGSSFFQIALPKKQAEANETSAWTTSYQLVLLRVPNGSILLSGEKRARKFIAPFFVGSILQQARGTKAQDHLRPAGIVAAPVLLQCVRGKLHLRKITLHQL